jgi:hypothetical protein
MQPGGSEMEFVRQPRESLAAFRGRERRERNDAVDALGLKAGDPIYFAGRSTRFDPKRHTRMDRSYGFIKRLNRAETKELESMEEEKRKREERLRTHIAQQEEFRLRPEVRAANSIRFLIEDNLGKDHR